MPFRLKTSAISIGTRLHPLDEQTSAERRDGRKSNFLSRVVDQVDHQGHGFLGPDLA